MTNTIQSDKDKLAAIIKGLDELAESGILDVNDWEALIAKCFMICSRGVRAKRKADKETLPKKGE